MHTGKKIWKKNGVSFKDVKPSPTIIIFLCFTWKDTHSTCVILDLMFPNTFNKTFRTAEILSALDERESILKRILTQHWANRRLKIRSEYCFYLLRFSETNWNKLGPKYFMSLCISSLRGGWWWCFPEMCVISNRV